jgi:hypothetical protein
MGHHVDGQLIRFQKADLIDMLIPWLDPTPVDHARLAFPRGVVYIMWWFSVLA